ncbi:MAG: hypothetical protein U5R31_05315 [Acidimicrobiia bacterium]|nr:hypothetical protein [Acidimicrobiia bacterium]
MEIPTTSTFLEGDGREFWVSGAGRRRPPRTRCAEETGDDLDAAVMPVEPHLGHEHPLAAHRTTNDEIA